MIEKNVATLQLDGTEQAVEFKDSMPYYWIDNRSDGPVYVSMQAGISEGADGVYSIPPKDRQCIGTGGLSFYIKGTGEVYIRAQGIAHNPFDSARKGGDLAAYSGQSNTIENTVDAPCYVTDFPVNLFNPNGNINSNARTGLTLTENTFADGILTTNANIANVYAVGQIIKTQIGKVYAFSAKLVSLGSNDADGAIFIHDKTSSENNFVFATEISKRYTVKRTATTDTMTFAFGCMRGTGAKFTDIMVEELENQQAEPRGFIPYGGGTVRTEGENGEYSEIFISSDSEKPVAGLKTFGGSTNIISDFDVSLAYFKSKKDAAPTEALKQEIDRLKTYSGQSGTIKNTIEAPAYIADYPVNIFKITSKTETAYGLTYAIDGSKSEIKINGTFDSNAPVDFHNINYSPNLKCLPNGTYTLSGGTDRIGISVIADNTLLASSRDGKTRTFEVNDSHTTVFYRLYINSNEPFNDYTIFPCLVKGTEYRGFIPCSGGTVRTCGKNIFGGEALINAFKALTNVTINENVIKYNAWEGVNEVLVEGIFKPNTEYTVIFKRASGSNNYANLVARRENNGACADAFTFNNDGYSITYIAASSNLYKITRAYNDGTTYLDAEKCGIFEGHITLDDFEPYRESEIFLSPDTPFPAAGLKTFDSVTNIFSDFDVKLKYFKDTEKAVPEAALENKLNTMDTTLLFSGTASESAPAKITNRADYKYLLVRLADSTAGVLTAAEISALTGTATEFTVGSGTFSARFSVSQNALQMWSSGNITVIGVK